MVQRQHCTGERFRLETTFNGIKEYFHGYVQQHIGLNYRDNINRSQEQLYRHTGVHPPPLNPGKDDLQKLKHFLNFS